jgi:hypothetical protein
MQWHAGRETGSRQCSNLANSCLRSLLCWAFSMFGDWGLGRVARRATDPQKAVGEVADPAGSTDPDGERILAATVCRRSRRRPTLTVSGPRHGGGSCPTPTPSSLPRPGFP